MKPSNAFVFVCSKRIVENGRRQDATLADSDSCLKPFAVVSALADPRRERPPAVYGHVINSPTHFNVPIRPSDERPPAMYGHFCLVPRVSVHDRYYCKCVITGHVGPTFWCSIEVFNYINQLSQWCASSLPASLQTLSSVLNK